LPELPEVETIKNDLIPQIVGRTITEAAIFWPNLAREPSAEELSRCIAGREVLSIGRRGKHFLFHLSGGKTLIAHLKMSGAFLIRSPEELADRHMSAIFYLDDGRELRLVDPRKFATLWLVDTTEEERIIGKLGPEPLEPGFTPEVLAGLLEKRKVPIKPLLMDQEVVAGLGNIYADEILFEAGIHPARKAFSLTRKEIERLHHAIQAVLIRGIKNRGTTVVDYQDAYGRPGSNQFYLNVYNRAKKPCPRCGTPIQRMQLRGRSAHFCPHCQPLEREEGVA